MVYPRNHFGYYRRRNKYGGNKGSLKVVDTLATLAFDFPRRSTFFRQELKNFLILSKEQGLNL
jgi:membrane-bound lytic murein transglycosylase B